jgi:hypothetical protein
METKQTAIEFAVEKLAKFIPSGNQLVIHIILQEAKEIEKKQIIDTWDDGYETGYGYLSAKFDNAEQYYNETFKK